MNYYPPLPRDLVHRHCVVRGPDTLVVHVNMLTLGIHVATSSVNRMDDILARLLEEAPIFRRGNGTLSRFIMQRFDEGREDFEPAHIAGCAQFTNGDAGILDYLH